MIYFIDFDGTLFDTSVINDFKGSWKEKGTLIKSYIPIEKGISLLKDDNSFIISGNLKSHIKATLDYFKIPYDDKRIIGYRRGMPTNNLERKIAVINDAIKRFNLQDGKDEITYIGDEEDDLKACQKIGIKFIRI